MLPTFRTFAALSRVYYPGLNFVTQLFLEQLLSRKGNFGVTKSLASNYLNN